MHVIILVLARNDEDGGELAVETVGVGGVDKVAEEVSGIGGGLTDEGFVAVVERDDGVEVDGVGEAGLGIGSTEGAGSCCVGGGWRRGGGCCSG